LGSGLLSAAGRYVRSYPAICAAAAELLDAGIAAGQIRGDVGEEDVLTSMNAVWTIAALGERWACAA
jgi:hypothetical protein